MSEVSRESVRGLILLKARRKARALGIDDEIFKTDFSLTGTGVFDSMDILDLIGDIESVFQTEVDLSGFEPSEFSTLEGFVNCVLSGHQE